MTAKRPDESQTEFTVRAVREEAQREVLAELRATVLDRQIAAVNRAAEHTKAKEWEASSTVLATADTFHEVIGLIDEKRKELS